MNRCKICGALNDSEAFLCKSCKTPLAEEKNVDKPSMFLDSILGILFILYGIGISIANLIILKEILLEPVLFIVIGIYTICSNISISSTKYSLHILEIQHNILQQKIQELENKIKNTQ